LDGNGNPAPAVTSAAVLVDNGGGGLVYVQFSASPGGSGTLQSPYNTVASGVSNVVSSGVIRLLAGSSSETPTITKAMTLEAQNGLVRIGSASANSIQMTSTSAGDTGDSGTASDDNASGSASVTTLIAAGPDDGENSEAGIVRDGYVYALALPAEQDALGSRILEDEGTIALRLHSDEAIDKDSVTAYGPDGTYALMEGAGADGTDLWVLITPSGAVEAASASASGSTNSGSTVDSGEHVFVSGSEPASVPGLPAQVGVGDILLITPQTVYSEAQTVLVPVPPVATAGELTLYYYHASSDSEVAGWYPSDNVLGFMQSGSAELVEQDGVLYYSVALHHGAIVQLGYR